MSQEMLRVSWGTIEAQTRSKSHKIDGGMAVGWQWCPGRGRVCGVERKQGIFKEEKNISPRKQVSERRVAWDGMICRDGYWCCFPPQVSSPSCFQRGKVDMS